MTFWKFVPSKDHPTESVIPVPENMGGLLQVQLNMMDMAVLPELCT